MTVYVNTAQLGNAFERLQSAYGPQHWWPATDPENPRFEILIGAVLTQHTTWAQVEKAIANLRAAGALTPEAMLGHGGELSTLIRPAGTHNIKAERLRALCDWFIEAGGFAYLDLRSTTDLRAGLLACRGIGAETADVILVYAFSRPLFVADAYAFRIFERLGWIAGPRRYDVLRRAVEAATPRLDAAFYNELHALIVRHAKTRCHKRQPDCQACPLVDCCDYPAPRVEALDTDT
ncbi:hypothetical protein HKX42_01990 [Salinisphaera sp. USBA-960]|uniref:endonuclease III domain-containing protein n=1 Tax=Salinisphaera orenii TaxID=856731 RepID=UPI000DBE9495|nr:hypothetical protein [Salifodinibacter halophilus]NNC25647.1 hypothetical protein [Salifodinibacter halophilus]